MPRNNFDIKNYSDEDLDKLPPREREVLLMHFWQGKTLEDIGQYFNLTRSRIGQLKDKGIQRLRGITGKMG